MKNYNLGDRTGSKRHWFEGPVHKSNKRYYQNWVK